MRLFVTDTLCVNIPVRSGIAVGFSTRNFIMHVADLTLQFPSYEKARCASNAIADAVLRKVGVCSIRSCGAMQVSDFFQVQ